MSVIEFFTNYWDWYLLIGMCLSISAWATDRENRGLAVYLVGFIAITFLWPTRILSAIEQKLQ